MTPTVSAEQARWFRLRRSGLIKPFATPEVAASALFGVQAQILPAAGLSLWNRTPRLTHDEFDRRLHDARTLVKLWGQRHTLHLYPSAEWPLLHSALAPQRTWWEERVERESDDGGVGYRALVKQVEAMLRERGTLARSDLRASDLPLEAWHLSAWGGLFADLVRRGHACHAPPVGGEGRFAHREHWLPHLPWEPPAPAEANAEIARRFLHTYGPATRHDLAYWRGSKITPAKRWLAALGDAVAEVRVEGEPMLALREDLDALQERPPPRESWPVRMLYRFDPLLLGLKDKSWIVARDHYARVWRPAGHIEGSVLEHGRLVATWRYKRRTRDIEITVHPFAPPPAHVRDAVERHAQGVADFFGLALADLRWTDAHSTPD